MCLGGGGYKPLIATSLAIALGVSVVSGATNSYAPIDRSGNKFGIYDSTAGATTPSSNGNVFTAIDATNSSDPTKSKNAFGIKQLTQALAFTGNATFESVKGAYARGINTFGTGSIAITGSGSSLVFAEILGTTTAYGIDNSSSASNAVKLGEGNLTFTKIIGTTSSVGFQNTGSGTGLKVGDNKAATLTFTKIGGTDTGASSGSAYGMLLNGAANEIVVNGITGGDDKKAKILFTDISAKKTAVGIMHKQGSANLNVGQYGDITFTSITSTGASAIGIQSDAGNTITLGNSTNAGTITFSSIATSAASGSGSSMGVYATKNTTLNVYGAVKFSSITSTTNDAIGAYSTKDSTSAQGELKIDVKTGGSLTFTDISSTSATTSGNAYGLKASNKLHLVNASSTGVTFTKIESKSNFAYGLRSREIVIDNTGSKAITFGEITAKGISVPNLIDGNFSSVVGIMLDGGKTATAPSEFTNLSLKGNITFTSLSAPYGEYVIYAQKGTTNPTAPLKIATAGASTITATGTNNLVGIATTGTTKIDTTTAALTLDLQGKNGGTTSVTGLRAMGGSFELSGDKLQLKVGETTNTAKAYGVKLENGSISGDLAFDGTNSWVKVKDAASNIAYGIHTSGTSAINGTIRFASGVLAVGTHSKAYALYNEGNLTLNSGSKIIVGADTTGADANLYVKTTSDILNASFDAGSTTTFNGKAFGGTGEIILTLGNKAKVVFNNDTIQDTGNQLAITSDGADILISGSDVEKRFATKAFKGRKMEAYTADFKGTNIILAASTKAQSTDERLYVSDSFSLVGSSTGVEDSNLHVVVDEYGTNADKYAVLAAIDRGQNGDATITFNGLKSDNSEVETTTYSGFATAKVAIKRFDVVTGSNTISYYASNLMSTDISVNTDFVAPATAALSAGVSLFSANLNSLSKRMGELRNDPYSQGAWARVFGGEQTTNFGAKQSTVYSTVQAGYDYKLALGDAANYIGAAISYTKGMGGQVNPAIKTAPTPLDLPVAGLTSSDTDGVEVALYNSYVANSGLYSDSIVKFGYYMTDLTMPLINDPYSTSNLAIAVSEEIGYKVSLGESNEWFITPQGEVAFAYIGGTEFTQDYGTYSLKSTQDAVSLLRARVGAAWGYDFSYLAKESDVKASIYLGTYYAYDYFMGGDTTLSTNAGGKTVDYTHNAYEGTGRFVMNLGTNIDVQDRTKVYFDFEKSFGGNIQTDYQVSLGVRFGFGEKVSAPKQEEKKSSEPILKPKELDENAAE